MVPMDVGLVSRAAGNSRVFPSNGKCRHAMFEGLAKWWMDGWRVMPSRLVSRRTIHSPCSPGPSASIAHPSPSTVVHHGWTIRQPAYRPDHGTWKAVGNYGALACIRDDCIGAYFIGYASFLSSHRNVAIKLSTETLHTDPTYIHSRNELIVRFRFNPLQPFPTYNRRYIVATHTTPLD